MLRHRPFVRPSCVYRRWRERFRRHCGAIHQRGDLVCLCTHTSHICLNDTSVSMERMKHVTQTHQHPTPTPLCHPSDSSALSAAQMCKKLEQNANMHMFTETGYTAKERPYCAIVLPLNANVYLRISLPECCGL